MVLLGVVQISTAMLQAVGKVYAPVIALSVGACAKLGINLFGLTRLGIYAVAWSNLACYGVAAIIDLAVLAVAVRPKVQFWRGVGAPVVATAMTSGIGYGVFRLLTAMLSQSLACVIAICLGVAVYVLLILACGAVSKEEACMLPVLGRLTGFRKIKRARA